MSFKLTGVLLLVFALLGSYVYTSAARKPAPPREQTTYVYQYEMSDIVRLEVNHRGDVLSMTWDDSASKWHFADPSKGPVDAGRANGIRLLLSGPGARRVLVVERATPAQIADYGLASPQIVATIALRDGQVHRVLLGDKTPDGRNYYTKNDNSDTIYLVDFSWGDELARFVKEPPVVNAPSG